MTSNFFYFLFLACRLRAAGRAQADGSKKTRTRERGPRSMAAPEANAELQSNIDVCQISCLC